MKLLLRNKAYRARRIAFRPERRPLRAARYLRSLTLERTSDDAEIVAEMTLDDGTPLTERYSVWTYDTPPDPNDPNEAREAAFMIAMGLTKL